MIEVRGADQLARLSAALRAAGDKGLQIELNKAINRATGPIKVDIHQSAGVELPHRGGLAARAARSRLATRSRRGARVSGVRVVSTDRSLSMWHLNQGIARHHRKGGWTQQHIRGGFWDDATQKAGPQARRELEAAMAAIAHRIGMRL
jgi:hypothetical protein